MSRLGVWGMGLYRQKEERGTENWRRGTLLSTVNTLRHLLTEGNTAGGRGHATGMGK